MQKITTKKHKFLLSPATFTQISCWSSTHWPTAMFFLLHFWSSLSLPFCCFFYPLSFVPYLTFVSVIPHVMSSKSIFSYIHAFSQPVSLLCDCLPTLSLVLDHPLSSGLSLSPSSTQRCFCTWPSAAQQPSIYQSVTVQICTVATK